jgi:hypothetical protein
MITNREIEEVSASRTVRLSNRLEKVIAPILRWVLKPFPGVRARLAETIGGRSGDLFRLMEKRQFPEAFKCALAGVMYCETRRFSFGMQNLYWWVFMESAARSASELGDIERQQVLARARTPPKPGGLYEARCLEMFSRWRWSAGAADEAIDLARRAVMADATWPQAHIILAWYGLITGKFDPLPRLREAIRVSSSALHEIRADADFARFPELLAALEQEERTP